VILLSFTKQFRVKSNIVLILTHRNVMRYEEIILENTKKLENRFSSLK
jgi:hypothetical protein